METQEVELTQHEQDMINKVDEAHNQAAANANPEEATPMVDNETPSVEQTTEEPKEEVKTPPKDLDIKQDKQPEETPKEEPKVITPEDLSKYTEEFTTNGSLSEETYKELEASGYSKEVVDTYVRGQVALRELETSKVFDSVGGKEVYGEMIEFAKEQWTEEQINGYNAAVNSGDANQVNFAVNSLKSQFEAYKKSPIPNRAISGNSQATSTNTQGFATKADMMKAMSDPRYYKDASYNKMVMEKVALSNF